MKLLTYISRILVGSLFIVSGLLKANDPLGMSYKLEEYFQVFGMEGMSSFALPLAAFLCILEIVAGISTLMGSRMKPMAWVLLLIILFFTFLTWYSAYFNKVTDCGCFGDALKITPWESFWKDVALLAFILVIFVRRKSIAHGPLREDAGTSLASAGLIAVFCLIILSNPWAFPIWFTLALLGLLTLIKQKTHAQVFDRLCTWLTAAAALAFTIYCYTHLPVKDFRPYAVGKNIWEQMSVPEGAPQDEYETNLQYKNLKTGEVRDFTMQDYPWKDTLNWQYHNTISKILKEGYHPPIHDFTITGDDGDITEEVITNPGYNFIVVAYSLGKTHQEAYTRINALAAGAEQAGVTTVALTASTHISGEFRHEVQAMYPFYAGDETALKTIVRSNPGLLLLKGGTILAKWHYNDIPEFAGVRERYMK